MNKKAKFAIAAVLVVCLVLTMAVSAAAPLEAPVLTVESGTAAVTFTQQGNYTFDKTVEVFPQLGGEVEKILVTEGQQVKAGDPIAAVSASDVEFQIRQLQSDIKGYSAQSANLGVQEQKEKDTLLGTKNDLLGQRTALDSQIENLTTAEETRQSQIDFQQQIVSQDRANQRLARAAIQDMRDGDDWDRDSYDGEYDAARQAYNDAGKALAASEQELARLQGSEVKEGVYQGQKESLDAQIGNIDTRLEKSYSGALQSYYAAMIENAKVRIEQLTQQQGQATITAPVDGVISALPVEASNRVVSDSVIAAIGTDPVVEVYVPVREIAGIHQGDKVELTVRMRTGDILCTGRVTAIDSQAKTMLSTLGVEESKIRVLITPDKSCLGIGYQVDATFTVYRQEDCVVIPRKAVFQQEGQDSVWVLQDGIAAIQPVAKGVETREGYIIDEGLQPGDLLVAQANLAGLAPGKKIAPTLSVL